jgi:hypothetical protein
VDKQRDWGAFCDLIHAADEIAVNTKPRSEAALALMFGALKRFEFGAVCDAISQHVNESRFAVTPADITRIIVGSPEELSLKAWHVFLQAVDRYGYYDSVRFPDPAYHYAVQHLGGWERLCEELHCLSDKELQFRGRDWQRLYERGLRCASWSGEIGKEHVPSYLQGFFERDNRDRGFPEFVPMAIDIASCEMVALPVTDRLAVMGIAAVGEYDSEEARS